MIKIGGLQKLTLIDYPGRLAATVFLYGCNFRCPWCYAPHLVLPANRQKQKNLEEISQKDFLNFLKERKTLLDGLVICGGEPTVNPDLPQFIKKIKKLSYLVKLDTNGSNPDMLKELVKKEKPLLDYLAMDIKAPLKKKKYQEAVQIKVDLDKIKKSIEIVKHCGIDYEFRTTFVPGLHTKEDIIEIAKEIAPAKKYYLQNFRAEHTIEADFEKRKPYPLEDLLEIQKIISPFFETCQVR